MSYRLALVIPIYNEQGNILPLVNALRDNRVEPELCPYELILVNNGSSDNSAQEIEEAVGKTPWIRVIRLKDNVGYGGGIQRGLKSASTSATHVGWIPADHQYSVEDLLMVWKKVLKDPMAVHKGLRTVRKDGRQSQLVSQVYTNLTRYILGVKVQDVNALPKIFPLFLLKRVDFTLSSNFMLDGQILLAAQHLKLPIREHPLTFHARRSGVSSWSGRRIRVYAQTIRELIALRFQSKRWFTSAQSPT